MVPAGPRNEVAPDMKDLNPAPSRHVFKGLVPDHIIRMAVRSGPRVYQAIQIHAKIPGDRVGLAGI